MSVIASGPDEKLVPTLPFGRCINWLASMSKTFQVTVNVSLTFGIVLAKDGLYIRVSIVSDTNRSRKK